MAVLHRSPKLQLFGGVATTSHTTGHFSLYVTFKLEWWRWEVKRRTKDDSWTLRQEAMGKRATLRGFDDGRAGFSVCGRWRHGDRPGTYRLMNIEHDSMAMKLVGMFELLCPTTGNVHWHHRCLGDLFKARKSRDEDGQHK